MKFSINELLHSIATSLRGFRQDVRQQSARLPPNETSPAMKLVIKEYLRSLKERDELDAVLPDMLLELNYEVFSRPAKGVRQNGVDIAAVGIDDDGQKKVFLISVKAGDLNRADWNNGTQALRPSLDEILDVYIKNVLPSQFRGLPIVICICFGGDLHQNVAENVEGYVKNHKSENIDFQIWNGDFLAGQLIKGMLNADLLSDDARVFFRKSVAMLDEPEASYSYFRQLVQQLVTECGDSERDKIRVARQINLCLWVLYVWSRDAGNLESPYRCSEFATLHLWELGTSNSLEKAADVEAMDNALASTMNLHLRIATTYAEERILPATRSLHGLSAAVRASESLEVNLKLFEIVGRLSLFGIWLQKLADDRQQSGEEQLKDLEQSIQQIVDGLPDLLNHNPVLNTPIMDQQAIEINLACCFMFSHGERPFVKQWITTLINATIFAFEGHQAYPCIFTDYSDLLSHPRQPSDEYRREATAGSILFPTLAFWAVVCELPDELEKLATFAGDNLDHCTMQLWFPNDDSETHIYTNSDTHGVALTGLEITADGQSLMQAIRQECEQNDAYRNLSAIRFGHWPLVLMACRHYRLPLPPNVWMTFFPKPPVEF